MAHQWPRRFLSVAIFHMSIWKMSSAAFISNVTMVFQNGALFDSLTFRSNVACPLRGRDDLEEKRICETVDELLKLVGASEIPDLLSADISTGMKRSSNYEDACGRPKSRTLR